MSGGVKRFRVSVLRIRAFFTRGLSAVASLHAAISLASPLSAQVIPSSIVPDASLGSESSQVTSGARIDQIDGGAIRGQNVFHSFREFNVGEQRGAYLFVPSSTIQNVLVRITGRNPSKILGTLGTFRIQNSQVVPSTATLFLINPNGIVFGENSSLDLGGSFVATTANAVQFGNRGTFDASQPTLPSSILTIDPSALLYSAISPQNLGVINRSTVTSNNLVGETTGLQVGDGKSLLLVGGNVALEGGFAQVKGGRIELGGLAESGAIGLETDADQVRLNFAERTRSNVVLTNGAEVEVLPTSNSGNIAIYARNLEIANKSTLAVGSEDGVANPNFRGNITLDVIEAMKVANNSLILNLIRDRISSKDGNIKITANALQVDTDSGISASTIGEGNTGNITIDAKNIVSLSNSGVITARVLKEATGNAGNVEITTRFLSMTKGGQIQSVTSGEGNAGNVSIRVEELFFADGERSARRSSGILTTVEPEAKGRGGNIEIKTGSLRFSNGAQLVASTRGRGDAGNVTIEADNRVSFDGKGQDTAPTGAFSNVNLASVGQGGTIKITANTLGITNGAQLQAFTRSQGNAGNFVLRVKEAILIDGEGFDQIPSGIFSSVEDSSAIGNSGTIDLKTGFLLLTNGGAISTGVQGQGNGGTIIVNAPRILLAGESQQGLPSTIQSAVFAGARGRGGNILLDSDILAIVDGANLEARTFGVGDAGNIELNLRDRVVLSRGDVFTAVQPGATGRGGNITVNTGAISFLNASQFVSSSRGIGDAGNIKITARDQVLFNGGINRRENTSSGAFSSVDTGAIGQGGKIEITAGSLSVLNGAQINALTRGKGNAGIVLIDVTGAVLLDGRGPTGARSEIGSTSELRAVGDGGSIRITAASLSLTRDAAITTGSSTQGNAGNIAIKLRGFLQMENGTISSGTFRSSGSSVSIDADRIQLSKNSSITTTTLEGAGSGGNINLTARSIIALDNSDILAFAQEGKGGNINLNTRAFFGQNYRPAPPGTNLFSLQFNNRVDVNASGAISGVITLPDTTFIQNSLSQLPQNEIDTNTLLANTCIVRNQRNGTFYITGKGGLTTNPGELSAYPTGAIQSTGWKRGDPIVEPQGVYQLPSGQLLLSRECE